MAFVHGKDTYVSLGGDDISEFCNTSGPNRSADSHDVTTYGKNAHVFKGGLKNGTNTIGGFYDDSATGPKAVIEPLLGTVVELIYRPEGTGTGKPQDTVDVLVTAYNQSAPVADMIQWTAELQYSDDVVTTNQV